MAKSLPEENLLPLFIGPIISYLILVMLLNKLNVKLLVSVDHCQQRTMASETIDLIDWPMPLTLYRGSTVCAPLPGIEHSTFLIPDNRLTYAATEAKTLAFVQCTTTNKR